MLAEAITWSLFGLGVVLALGGFSRWLLANPRETVDGGLVWQGTRLYAHFFHHLSVEGKEHLPRDRYPGPLVVVMNHTAGVDPVLVQSICRFYVRYVMAQDMRLPAYEWIWQWARTIFVDRTGGSTQGTREALRHLASGGVLGIFPEGGLERPPRHIMPFEPGVGMIVRRTGARVLPIVIEGTPVVDPAWASLWTPSRSRIRIMPPIDYDGSGLSAAEIADDLRERYVEWTGWPRVEQNGGQAREPGAGRARGSRSAGSLPAA
jgi:1-acyl-sn-glycerol-3-phosphate acyltransferase